MSDLTRELAVLARETKSGIFDADGNEITVTCVHATRCTLSAIDNYDDSDIYPFEELTTSRELRALHAKGIQA